MDRGPNGTCRKTQALQATTYMCRHRTDVRSYSIRESCINPLSSNSAKRPRPNRNYTNRIMWMVNRAALPALMLKNAEAVQHPQDAVTAVTAPRLQSGDEDPTALELCATLVACIMPNLREKTTESTRTLHRVAQIYDRKKIWRSNGLGSSYSCRLLYSTTSTGEDVTVIFFS